MRILVVVGPHRRPADAAAYAAGPEVRLYQKQGILCKGDGSQVVFRSIRSQQDADMMRGTRFDVVLEDLSFNPGRSHRIGDLLAQIKIMVLK